MMARFRSGDPAEDAASDDDNDDDAEDDDDNVSDNDVRCPNVGGGATHTHIVATHAHGYNTATLGGRPSSRPTRRWLCETTAATPTRLVSPTRIVARIAVTDLGCFRNQRRVRRLTGS